jgi:F-type H+-transporting ATPase subunit b
VININFTLLIQLINFLVLLFVLNALLFKPVLAKMREREARIKQEREKTQDLEQKVLDEENRHQEELAKARQIAAQEKATLMVEAKKKEAEILDKARGEASRIVDEMRTAIQGEIVEVKQRLREDMAPLARSMAEKLLGRAL